MKKKSLLFDSPEWKLANAQSALFAILKWKFVIDGRKFQGNHKEVCRQIFKLAKDGLGRNRACPKKLN